MLCYATNSHISQSRLGFVLWDSFCSNIIDHSNQSGEMVRGDWRRDTREFSIKYYSINTFVFVMIDYYTEQQWLKPTNSMICQCFSIGFFQFCLSQSSEALRKNLIRNPSWLKYFYFIFLEIFSKFCNCCWLDQTPPGGGAGWLRL